jgi:hypothetical protein
MHAVNALRLVLGTMLDVDEEDPLTVDPEDRTREYMLYGYLGLLLEEIVQAQLAVAERGGGEREAGSGAAIAPRPAPPSVGRRLDERAAAAFPAPCRRRCPSPSRRTPR